MKSFFTKLGALLLCGVMFTAVGCHDYAEDIQKANDRTEEVADELTDLKVTVAGLDAKYEALGAAQKAVDALRTELEGKIATAVAEAKASVEALLAGKADKATVDAMQSSISDLVSSLNTAKSALEAAINAKADKTAIEGLQSTINGLQGQIEALQATVDGLGGVEETPSVDASALTAVADRVAALEKTVGDLNTAVKAAEEAIKANASEISKVQAELKKLTEQIAEATKNAVTEKELDEIYQKAKAYAEEAVAYLKSKVYPQLEEAFAAIKVIAGALELTQAEVDLLFSRIQSVVYVPKANDHKAEVAYAEAYGKVLEGYSQIAYQVYPAADAKFLAAAFNATENPISLAFVGTEVAVKAGADALQIVAAEATAEGQLIVTFKANLGEAFYEGTTSYSAALVLNNPANEQNISTAYTNFTPGKKTEITFVPYVNGKEYDATAEYANVTWPFVAEGKENSTLEILAGVEARFVLDGTTTITADELTKMGYESAVTVETTAEHSEVILVGIEPSGVAKAHILKADSNNIGEETTVTKTLTWTATGKTAPVSAKLSVTNFDYVLDKQYVLTADGGYGATHTYNMPYINKANTVSAGVIENTTTPNFKLVFRPTDNNGVVIPNADAVDAKEMAAKYPTLVFERTIKYDGKADLFDVEEPTTIFNANDNNVALASVKLDQSVTFENVEDRMKTIYYYNCPILDQKVGCGTYTFRVAPMQYKYTLVPQTRGWNYTEDAKVDAGVQAQYCYAADVKLDADKSDKIIVDDIVLSKILQQDVPGQRGVQYEVKVNGETDTVVDPDNYTINFGAEDNSSIVKVKFLGMEFDKDYTITATNQLLTGKTKVVDGETIQIASAEVTVTFDLETAGFDVNSEALTLELAASTYELAPNLIITDQIADEITEDVLAELVAKFPAEYKGEGFDAANWFADALVANLKSANVKNSLNFGEVTIPHIEKNTLLDIATDGIYTKYNYASKYFAGMTMPTELTYTKTIVTYYGQKVVITKPIKFTLPEYTIVHNEFLVDLVDNVYQSNIQPTWTMEDGKVSGFSVKTINMYDAFLLKKNETVLSKADQKAESLALDFFIKGKTEGDNLPSIAENVITYNSPVANVGVGAVLSLVNTIDGVEHNRIALPIANVEEYASYVVNQYNPLGQLEQNVKVSENVTEMGQYSLNIAKALNLKDRNGISFIKNGVFDATTYNYSWAEEDNFFGLVMEEIDIESIEVPVSLEGNVSITPVYESGILTDYTVTFNYNTQIQMTKSLVIEVPVKLTHIWGETSTTVKVEFVPVKAAN